MSTSIKSVAVVSRVHKNCLYTIKYAGKKKDLVSSHYRAVYSNGECEFCIIDGMKAILKGKRNKDEGYTFQVIGWENFKKSELCKVCGKPRFMGKHNHQN